MSNRLPTPSTDLSELTNLLGVAWGVTAGFPVLEYIYWSDQLDLFQIIYDQSPTSIDISRQTELSEHGTDALLCVLASVGLVRRLPGNRNGLTLLGEEYLLKGSCYYAGHGLFAGLQRALPSFFLRSYDLAGNGRQARQSQQPLLKLRVQHSRNFAASVVAVRSGLFEGVKYVVDIGGGSGVFAIPLALDRPQTRITLVDLPAYVQPIKKLVSEYGLNDAIEVRGMDALHDAWQFEGCDGVLFGNVLHGVTDEECALLIRRSFDTLAPGGRVWLHEVLLSEERNGPLLAALWNANMLARGGRQRTGKELVEMLAAAGFVGYQVVPTAANFSLIVGSKPEVET